MLTVRIDRPPPNPKIEQARKRDFERFRRWAARVAPKAPEDLRRLITSTLLGAKLHQEQARAYLALTRKMDAMLQRMLRDVGRLRREAFDAGIGAVEVHAWKLFRTLNELTQEHTLTFPLKWVEAHRIRASPESPWNIFGEPSSAAASDFGLLVGWLRMASLEESTAVRLAQAGLKLAGVTAKYSTHPDVVMRLEETKHLVRKAVLPGGRPKILPADYPERRRKTRETILRGIAGSRFGPDFFRVPRVADELARKWAHLGLRSLTRAEVGGLSRAIQRRTSSTDTILDYLFRVTAGAKSIKTLRNMEKTQGRK